MHVILFPKPLNEWCFCGRVSWGFCRARRPECHRSRLIYPPPLSSCYAWSLNFPFLLFFLCFCSQIPPRPLHPLTPLLSLPIFSLSLFFLLRGRPVLAEHDTRSTHATLLSSPRARSSSWIYVALHELASPKCETQCTATPKNTLLRVVVLVLFQMRSFSGEHQLNINSSAYITAKRSHTAE